MSDIAIIRQETEAALADPETLKTLVATTFKGLNPALIKQAIVEGRIRGFTFKDFLEKNIYAVPFAQTYSLVTSIDHARKVGMRSGVIGKSEPQYEERENDGKVLSCSITIKRRVGQDVGEYTAKVYFSEYSTGKNLWLSKPRTMIAKVAEMRALSMACPEELAQAYTEEEMEKGTAGDPTPRIVANLRQLKERLEACQDLDELAVVWAELPAEAKTELAAIKDERKKRLSQS